MLFLRPRTQSQQSCTGNQRCSAKKWWSPEIQWIPVCHVITICGLSWVLVDLFAG
jgi:hypothetical protein